MHISPSSVNVTHRGGGVELNGVRDGVYNVGGVGEMKGEAYMNVTGGTNQLSPWPAGSPPPHTHAQRFHTSAASPTIGASFLMYGFLQT